jgi:hypothetical protein
MARLDGTGPRGQGPMTGRGMGYCGNGASRGLGMGYGRGAGRGFGRGQCLGLGQGLGLGRTFISPKNNIQVLEDEEKALEEELVIIKAEKEALKNQK